MLMDPICSPHCEFFIFRRRPHIDSDDEEDALETELARDQFDELNNANEDDDDEEGDGQYEQ